MTLNERKIKILEAIINDYIATAEPIGSRTIAKKYGFGISSATIRNEMSDLEEMGFIIQPHASAGRVPSDLGYRLYVDTLMRTRELNEEERNYLRRVIEENISRIDDLMMETAKAISYLTNYTTIVSEPNMNRQTIKHIQLVPVDEQNIAIVLVTNDKIVKNHVVRVHESPDFETLTKLSAVLNKYLSGADEAPSAENLKAELEQNFPNDSETWQSVLSAISNQLYVEQQVRIYTSGVKNILEFPEFADINKAKAVFTTLEEQEMLITLLNGNDYGDVSVVIGSENSLLSLKDCSIIKTSYGVGKNKLGSIGIIGPTRMDYSQVASVLNGIVKYINYAISALKGG